MNTFVTNPTFALVELGEKLLEATEQDSRAGKTHELLLQTIMICKPQQRCFILPHRNDNIFAKIAETLWVLAGRNDVKFLSTYLPRAIDYSDDGRYWRAGYGSRMRGWYGYGKVTDQLERVITKLTQDRYTRQAVMAFWDPGKDYIESKDIPCLSGDTILKSPESNKSLAQLAYDFSTAAIGRYPIYAFDTTTKDMKLAWCTNVWKSGYKHVVKIYFDDNTTLTCTPDHRLFAKTYRDAEHCTEVEASDLKIGDRVWASKIWSSAKCDLFKINLRCNTRNSNMQKVHRAYYELVNGNLSKDIDVHHDDENPHNNVLSNLKAMSHGEHSTYHRIKNNPMHNMSKESRIAKGKRHSDAMKAYWKNTDADRLALQSNIGKHRTESRDASGQFAVNHKVVYIEYLDDPISVYDFEVDTYHNAMLDNGVFIHNCNNWLHFIIRKAHDGTDELHLNIAQRSSDILWGFSGINTFEFSVIQMLVANFLDCKVGVLNYNITSLHIYEKHWKRLQNIVTYFSGKTIYDYGVEPVEFASKPLTSFADFDQMLDAVMDEREHFEYRTKDPFLNRCSDMLLLYNYWEWNEHKLDGKVIDMLSDMPDDDFKCAAIEYIGRTFKSVLEEVAMSDEIMTALTNCMPSTEDI